MCNEIGSRQRHASSSILCCFLYDEVQLFFQYPLPYLEPVEEPSDLSGIMLEYSKVFVNCLVGFERADHKRNDTDSEAGSLHPFQTQMRRLELFIASRDFTVPLEYRELRRSGWNSMGARFAAPPPNMHLL